MSLELNGSSPGKCCFRPFATERGGRYYYPRSYLAASVGPLCPTGQVRGARPERPYNQVRPKTREQLGILLAFDRC